MRFESLFAFKLDRKYQNNLSSCFQTLIVIFASLEIISAVTNELYKGDVTFYYEWKGNYGSCALNKSRTDPFHVAALSRYWMKLPKGFSNPNNHPLCGPRYCIKVNGARGSVVLKVSDTCVGCKPFDVDVPDKVFPMLDHPNKGRVKMTWRFIDCSKTALGHRLLLKN